MLYIWFPLSLHNVEDLLQERGIEIRGQSVRFWWNRFGLSYPSRMNPHLGIFVLHMARTVVRAQFTTDRDQIAPLPKSAFRPFTR